MENADNLELERIFGDILRRRRAEFGISQEELAFLAGVDRTFVSRIERGIRQPSLRTLIGLGKALKVSAADLLLETERLYLNIQTDK
ncbi:MAG: helix-turn-helix transcriptional regulator [Methylotenera sp.]|nr:helix-turn-helix transcriptional regulator [Methylotenera sp.]